MVRLTERPDMNIAVYRGRKTQQQQQQYFLIVEGEHFQSKPLCHFLDRVQLLKEESFPLGSNISRFRAL